MRIRLLSLLILLSCKAVSGQSFRQSARDTLARPVLAFPGASPKSAAQRFLPPQDAAAKCLPFFCEQERRLDKKLVVPLRFRLGSQQQADWLERKSSAIRPQ